MNTSRLLTVLSLLAAMTLTVSASTEENFNETRDAKPGGKLVVEVDFGTIDVAAGDSDKVVVTAHRKIEAGSKEKEQSYLAAAPVVVTTEGNTVAIRALSKKRFDLWNWFGRTRTDALYTIHVPSSFSADLQTAGGKVSANGLTGSIKVDTSGGDLKFENLHGPLKAETSGGHIQVIACEGALNVETSGGQILTSGGRGSLRAHTSGGTVSVENFSGDTDVESSGGQLVLDNIGGRVTGETSGGAIFAVLSSPVPGDVKLNTSAGAIHVLVPVDAGLNLDAETSAGHVTSTLPLTMAHVSEEGLKGQINGGGKLLHLRTSAGSIEIRSRTETAQQ